MTPPPRPRPLRIERITAIADLDALAAPLAELAGAADALVFSHPAFFLPWSRAAIANGQRPDCLALYSGTTLCGFLPFFARRDRHALLGRVLGPPRYGSSPPFDLLLAGVDETAAIAALGAEVRRHSWIGQDIRADVAGSRLGAGWADWFAGRGHAVERAAGPGYYLVRNAGSVAQFKVALPGRQRRECERHLRRLAGIGGFRLVRSGDAVGGALEAMQGIVMQSWKGSAEMARRGWTMLHSVALSMAEAGMLRLWLVEVEARPIAYLMEFEDRHRHRHAFHNAQVEADDHLGPGKSVIYTSLCAAQEEGVPVYEFWGYRDYLRRFSNGIRETRSVRIDNPGLLQRLQRSLLPARRAGGADAVGTGGDGPCAG